MEASSGTVLKSIPCCNAGVKKDIHIGKPVSGVCFRRWKGFPGSKELKFRAIAGPHNWDGGFQDRGHVDYYMVSPVCGKGKAKKGWNGVSTKKRMKLLKGLSKDLEVFSELGFGLDLNCDEAFAAGDGEKTKMISQAADVLVAQLKQLRAEEEKSKKSEKEEKQKSKSQDCESSSSSSSESSESSDSECDEVVDMNRFRNNVVIQPIETNIPQLLTEESSLPTTSSQLPPSLEQGCCNMILETTLDENAAIEVLNLEASKVVGSASSPIVAPTHEKRVEVCMGGKCKKSGAPALMQEFERVMGDEGTVVGCKCMGKCKSGPNVRVVLNGENVGDDSLRTPSNSLCIGVGLEDVELIVSNYFGKVEGVGLAVAALPS